MNLISFPGHYHCFKKNHEELSATYVSNQRCFWKNTNPDMALHKNFDCIVVMPEGEKHWGEGGSSNRWG